VLKTILIALACSAATATAVLTYTGRTVHSAPFQIDIPYGAGVKTTIDPANVWSWHKEWANLGSTDTADVLVDFDGDNQMDTLNPWVRVMITDLELVTSPNAQAYAWILDGTGKRLAAGVEANSGPVSHIALSTPIVLPVGSPLHVQVSANGANIEVHLVGRVVSL
jgi:hypothetical protein